MVFTVSCNSDEDPTELSNKDLKAFFVKDITQYINEINAGNWDVSIDYMYPELFKYATKDQLISAFELVEKSGMTMSIDIIDFGDVSQIVEEGEEQFCRIEYNAKIDIRLSDELEEMAETLMTSMENTYGVGSIDYDEDQNKYVVTASRIVIAITPKKTTNWKYLEYDTSQKELLNELLPKKVMEELNLKK